MTTDVGEAAQPTAGTVGPLDGLAVAAARQASVDAWHRAWGQFVHFTGDPIDTLGVANDHDDQFALGSIFCATYRVLGGARLDDETLLLDVDRARARASTARDLAHLAALEHLVVGDFSLAGEQWDAIEPGDFAAGRFAHDLYLHIGEVERRLESSERALAHFAETTSEPFVASQHAFSLEEAGEYDDAEALASAALDRDPLELWALHALAHVYESTDDQDAAIALLEDRAATWERQESLAVHVHWHHALRMIAAGESDRALALFDRLEADASTPFRLCDLASLLWRLEHADVDVGSRWRLVADRLAVRPERHTSGFLDLHMALAFQRVPEHQEASAFFDGVATAHDDDRSENGEIFRSIVTPLVEAIRLVDADPAAAASLIDSLTEQSHRIGGSIAQRDLITITRNALTTPAADAPSIGNELESS